MTEKPHEGRRTPFRSIWLNVDGHGVDIIDQRWLPHEFRVETLHTLDSAAVAIRDMWVRGAPLIGATAAYGMALAVRHDPSDAALDEAWETLHATRPTAINLRWALDDMRTLLAPLPIAERADAAYGARRNRRRGCRDQSRHWPQRTGHHQGIASAKKKGEPVNILTHCNAGWVATVDYGTATAPIYLAMESGVPVHVYVDETRPRNRARSSRPGNSAAMACRTR